MGESEEEEIEVTGTTVFDGSHLYFGLGQMDLIEYEY